MHINYLLLLSESCMRKRLKTPVQILVSLISGLLTVFLFFSVLLLGYDLQTGIADIGFCEICSTS